MDFPPLVPGFISLLVLAGTVFAYYRLRRSRGLAVTAEANSSPRIRPKTLRVSGVPREWGISRLQSFLEDQEGIISPVVKSLVLGNDGSPSVGTVTFQAVSRPVGPANPWGIPLDSESRSDPADKEVIELDDAFLGITPLYSPPTECHKIDIIAISGLGGHAFGSFKDRHGNHMWLRDSLPFDLTREDTADPIARVMIYGYKSNVVNSNSFQNLEDLASSFHHSLLALVRAPTTRPIIFIAHSLGGLIVKQALITLSKSKNEDDQRLLKAVYGIVFFGVPHDGMNIESLISMVGNSPNRFLVESLNSVNSQILSIQQRDFHDALGAEGDSEIVCFYETETSPTAQQSSNGDWSMSGPRICLVTKSSATHCRAWESGPEHMCATARTHSEMVKFGPHDHEYQKARDRILSLTRRAMSVQHRKRTANSKFLVPYLRNPGFIDRPEIFDMIQTQLGFGLRLDPDNTQQRISLHGLGGVGKTQLAIAYVYWLRKECPDVSVFWVHASNEQRFRQSYDILAEECQITGREKDTDLLALVKSWLETRFKGQWLMVIDNADNTELFFEAHQDQSHGNLGLYIPECAHGSILITTRNKQAGIRLSRGKIPIEVGNMNDQETSKLVRTTLRDDNLDDGKILGLATRLDNLPLALVQAASFIHENSITVDEYTKLLDSSNNTLVECLNESFEPMGRDSDTPHAVTTTWIISFEQIARQDRSASDIFSFMCLLDRQAIPMEFIRNYWHRVQALHSSAASQEFKITKALGTLKAFCFISEVKDHSYDMHRLVQLVARNWLIRMEKMAEFAQHTLLTVSTLYPHAYFANESLWKEAEKFQVEALMLMTEFSEIPPPATLTLMLNLALIYDGQGHWEKAETLLKYVLDSSRQTFGEEHSQTRTTQSILAAVYQRQGRLLEAEKLMKGVLDLEKNILGEEHRDTLTSMSALATSHVLLGRLQEAEDLTKRMVELGTKILGTDHLDTLRGMRNLSGIYLRQERFKEAEEVAKSVVEFLGDLSKAEELLNGVIELRKTVLGEKHMDTLWGMKDLACIWKDSGRTEDALSLMQSCANMSQEVCLAIATGLEIYNVSLGFGKDISEVDPAVVPTIALVGTLFGLFAVLSAAWSKTSFALTLLRLVDGWMSWFLWFLIIATNIIMDLVIIFSFVKCTPAKKVWHSKLPGTCWNPLVATYYNIFAGAFSGLVDLVLCVLAWMIIWKLSMRTREKIGVGIALTFGVFAAATAGLKCYSMLGLAGKNRTGKNYSYSYIPLSWC
ncbi:kinesin light chain 1 [Fusarium beomiforme]|uniref:Kinesin light chain 1 n=1 Tax=Fusarium beomiforme TaxID=44412 RepID=A0A9P5E0Z3_9HYPO|nr:kinesin light chain 1 [Fusarium beomiforme]